ncbi:MAG: adenylyl-sulfate kinase [Dehalococcoidia bacterium]|nr:adenylyl-sulfate kinase [Dehalococcoidia bacterium]|tara:strand:- start:8176 stop:8703 length:528 start_codon:yes stop_codon:yes gene_type:complete
MKSNGFTLWFTGLPCSGKSTLASIIAKVLSDKGHKVEVLDGDEVRRHLGNDLGFSKPERDENIRRITYVAKLLSRNGVITIVAAISPYRELRDEARDAIENFVEIYVKCNLDICAQRDVKGHYARASKGEITNFTGINDPYEQPLHPEVVVETDKFNQSECAAKIVDALTNLKCI